MARLYQNHEIRELEALSISTGTFNETTLMASAGAAAFQFLQKKWPNAKHIIVCCGKGNNAGDGYVVAKLAIEAGLQVEVYCLESVENLHGTAKNAAEEGLKSGLTYKQFNLNTVFHADVIVDALLGTGLKGEVTGVFEQAIEAVNASEAFVLALDVPSGIDADSGSILGCAVQADATITFIGLKPGLFTHQAPAYCGEIKINSLNIPDALFEKVKPNAELLVWSELKHLLPRRQRDAHKGDYGHVLVIGGDYGMGGAVRMAAEAAMRVGAGLVSVATRPEHVSVVTGSRPEIMCHQVANGDDLKALLKRVSVVVIGPGLGKSDWAKNLLATVLSSSLPKVLDADALNLLSQNPVKRDDWILTPHPGEASRLLDKSCQALQVDRFTAVKELQQRYGGVTILKGVGTIIAADNVIPKVCSAGNPGMATGGMGDILSGVVGGLLAQKLSLLSAAELAVLVHSMAADCAAAEGGERGLLASDLLKHLRELVNPDE